jgi:ATP sulfurylase
MKLRELFENKGNSVGVCFGRWNPPHKGHRAAWEIAANFGTFYVGTNKNTEGPNDPLPYEVKLKAMEKKNKKRYHNMKSKKKINIK